MTITQTRNGGALEIVHPCKVIREIFDVTGFSDILIVE